MKPGDIITTRNIRHYHSKGWFEYKPNDKKDNFVFLFLGCEPKDGSCPINPEKVLNALGWATENADKEPLVINMQSRPNPKDARSCKG